jgi:serine/threonine protein kinase
VGTQDYISPEALSGQKSQISFASDLWSFGVIVWQIFSANNLTPFAADSTEETFRKIKEAQFEMPEGPHLTTEVKDLISQLLVKDPTKRLGSDNIEKLL